MKKHPRIHVVSLGCAKNLVDTEVLCGQFLQAGFALTDRADDADVTLINTCSFIADARTEAGEEIRKALSWRTARAGRAIVVAGCLPQRDPTGTRAQYPGVDLLLGVDDIPHAAERLRSCLSGHGGVSDIESHRGPPSYLYDHQTARLQLTAASYAYVKIADGCDHHCAFCTIPAIRGRQRSRSVDSIVAECRQFLDQGVGELNLIAQDTTRYGRDRTDGASTAVLLEAIDRLPGSFWVRLLYTHPRYLSDELLDVVRQARHVVPYIDMPLQHIGDRMLQAMGRRMGGDETRALMGRLRDRWPGVAIRTSLLVGYPGETESDFAELLEFVRTFRFERLGVFCFSPEPGTPAARLRDNLVDAAVAQARRAALLEAQQAISLTRNTALLGTTVEVLVDHVEGKGRFAGRTTADAPDIDNLVHFRGPAGVREQRFAKVRIGKAGPYDLEGKVVA